LPKIRGALSGSAPGAVDLIGWTHAPARLKILNATRAYLRIVHWPITIFSVLKWMNRIDCCSVSGKWGCRFTIRAAIASHFTGLTPACLTRSAAVPSMTLCARHPATIGSGGYKELELFSPAQNVFT